MGEVPQGRALLRSGACAEDDVYVSGTLGDARLALEVFRGRLSLPADHFEQARRAMECPEPRVALGQELRGIASSAIDVSDGLLGDLAHILRRSKVGATLQADALPQSAPVNAQPLGIRREMGLAGGDDYELVFTAPPGRRDAVREAAVRAGTPITRIGRIEREPGLRLLDAQGASLANTFASFDHFKS